MGPTTRRWSFLIPVVLFTLACSLVVWLVIWLTGNKMDQAIWGIISYFMLLSIGLHAWQEHALERDPNGFIGRYIAGLSIKMFLSLLVLVALLLSIPKESRSITAITFILLYLAYLGFITARMAMLIKRLQHK